MYLILSLLLKCSSNIDSIHYLGLTNSYEFKFLRFSNEIKLAHLKVTGSCSIFYQMNWSARGNILNQLIFEEHFNWNYSKIAC